MAIALVSAPSSPFIDIMNVDPPAGPAPFSPQAVILKIHEQLTEKTDLDNCDAIADLLSMDATILGAIRQSQRIELRSLVCDYCDEKELPDDIYHLIQAILFRLYQNSLLNSSLNGVLNDLEKNLSEIEKKITPIALTVFQHQANKLLQIDEPRAHDWKSMSSAQSRLVEFINYSGYVDPYQRQALLILAKDRKGENPDLVQRLRSFYRNVETRLIDGQFQPKCLLKKLREKQASWPKRSFSSTSPDFVSFDPIFERRYQEGILLAGSQILETALHAEFSARVEGRRIPNDLFIAIQKTMSSYGMQKKVTDLIEEFKRCGKLSLPDHFAMRAWSAYLSEPKWKAFDLACLVLSLAKEVPKQQWDRFKKDLESTRNPREQAPKISDLCSSYQMSSSVDFQSLKLFLTVGTRLDR